jgi:hypothetical protein
MGLRFRRSFKVLPGIRLNVSKTGLSTSIGSKGATVNVQGNRVRQTIGIPGSGLSYSQEQRVKSGMGSLIVFVAILVAIAFAIFI